ncbi:unnamed protein product [Ilex paraguariensis]|uniref:Uncharacterized protein n=1 Tax=Ilex paraguariensis TaxID=185542 RepID=A0ABC8UDS9_9AQUA
METNRLRPLLNQAISYSSQLHRLRFISSSAIVGQRAWGFFSDDPEGGSAVYRHVLKFQRPSTIKYRSQLHNSVSFIGTINRPLTRINIGNGRFGVHTILNVKTYRDYNQSFRVLLKMWDEMAEMSVQHLKPNDLIYVSGHLGSYAMADETEDFRMNYKV